MNDDKWVHGFVRMAAFVELWAIIGFFVIVVLYGNVNKLTQGQ